MILGFKEKFEDGTPTHFVENILSGEKIHSLRAGNRWRAGMHIEMATGVRTKNYRQFNHHRPDQKTCFSIQNIIMRMVQAGEFEIIVDGCHLRDNEIHDLIKNDGLTEKQFVDWFFKGSNVWHGQIIHWTDFKY